MSSIPISSDIVFVSSGIVIVSYTVEYVSLPSVVFSLLVSVVSSAIVSSVSIPTVFSVVSYVVSSSHANIFVNSAVVSSLIRIDAVKLLSLIDSSQASWAIPSLSNLISPCLSVLNIIQSTSVTSITLQSLSKKSVEALII